jgi:hypothetical protein
MTYIKKGSLVQTTKGKIGEVLESESWVIKDKNNFTVSGPFMDKETCEAYKYEINPEYSVDNLPCIVQLGKSAHPIFSKNLKHLKTIYFKFKDYNNNNVVLKQTQTTGLILKKFLDKSNIKYLMFENEDEL